MVGISRFLEKLLENKSVQDMINKGDFRDLYSLVIYTDKLYLKEKLEQVINIIHDANIDPHFEENIPTLYKVMEKVLTSPRKEYIYVGVPDYMKSEDEYSYYKYKECIITEVEDVDYIDDLWGDAAKVFEDTIWAVKFLEDGETGNISGKYLIPSK